MVQRYGAFNLYELELYPYNSPPVITTSYRNNEKEPGMKIYQVYLNGLKIGKTKLEYADVTMGVYFGHLFLDK